MQMYERHDHLPALLIGISFAVCVFVALPLRLWAQSEDLSVKSIPADNELVVVAGGYGAVLYLADGAVLAEVGAAERLIASARSADDEWLLVRSADGREGWAMRSALLIFERMALPIIDLDVTAMHAATMAAMEGGDAAPEESATQTDVATVSTDEVTADAMTASTDEASTEDAADIAATPAPLQEPAMSGSELMAIVRTGNARLNVRSGPGTSYPIVAKAETGTTLPVIGRNDEQSWLQVELADVNGGFGWVATQFVAVTDPLGDLPVVDIVNDRAVALTGQMAGVQSSMTTMDPAGAVARTAPRAQAAGLHGKLVFLDRNGGDIYLYNLASGGLQQLTRGNDPALSPDGTQIVFTRGGGENGIYLINSDGTDERQIFGERELLRSPKWSPDGRWIVFSRGDEFNRCYLDEDTGECLRFTPFVTDGLESGKDHVRKLARIDGNGDNYRDLAVVPEAFAPDWSAGGIVYQSAAGLQITQDTPEDNNRLLYFEIRRQYHQDPDWQPGGGRIVFQQRQGSHYEIFAINSDGSGLTALTRPTTTLVDQLPSNVSPAWGPDGQSIVFLSNRTDTHEAGPWRLWVMNADGSNQRPLPINIALHYDYVLEQMVDWGP